MTRNHACSKKFEFYCLTSRGLPRIHFIGQNTGGSTVFSFFTFSSDFPCFFSLSMVEYY